MVVVEGVPIIGYFNSSIDLSIASLLAIACSQYDVLSDTFQNIYQIQSITDPKLFGLLPFQIVILSQIYLYCWFGNKVFYKSTQLIHSVYMLEWDKCSKKIRQTLCIIMDRSRRPININAGNLIPVRLDTFIQIVKSAYSMFAILQNMDNEIEN
ncbi:odorant receptor 94a-like [Chrysoperla carnea]|uniref:odorant receptor 94a-like n=1 Tax=Chrysoperla carnea TaxID=189513 RepID=UPI001D05C351|nr:odorant receptor 94a-like [Chrysoperla carnea]